MEWRFADRAGSLKISNFDNRNFTYPNLTQLPGPNSTYINQFHGNLGSAGFQGAARGSFVDGAKPAAGVIGNWNADASNGTYGATGIFGAAR